MAYFRWLKHGETFKSKKSVIYKLLGYKIHWWWRQDPGGRNVVGEQGICTELAWYCLGLNESEKYV